MEVKNCDFSGWATRNNLLCSDGRVIVKDAFKDVHGKTVPLLWNHLHNGPDNVIGHAVMENRDEGVYAYCFLNDTEHGRTTKTLIKHGDVNALSIWANNLKEAGSNVLHGIIRELSVVLAGANPGALVDTVAAHSDESGSCAIIYNGEEELFLSHADDSEKEKKKEKSDNSDDETIGDILNTLTEKQMDVVSYVVKQALEKKEEGGDDSEGGDDMKHNVFENDDAQEQKGYLAHSDQEAIMNLAKTSQVGSFQTALQIYTEENSLQHDALSSGFTQTGDGNVSTLFPEYKEVRPGAPELITNDQGWISTVMNKVHKSPISRIRTSQADIRNIETLRAKGYVKGKEKALAGNFKLIRRTTDPQTIYVKDALNRDDIVDMTDFDYPAYLYKIDRMMLNEELATAIMIGDGREDGDEGKISADHIRPIWLDDDLYTIHADLDVDTAKKELQGTNTGANFGENYIMAEAMVNTILYSREKYKGSGQPDLYIEPHKLNVMLLARDINGRRIYSSVAELASALNVANIYTAEQFVGKTRTTDGKEKKLLAIIVNLSDYSLGATKGGEITHFTDFDIDFNQLKSLLETRCSGALTRVYSAIAIEENVTTPAAG